jgi:predicted XRE-type DNA-binding protein
MLKMTNKAKTEKLLVTKSSGNIFADLGFDNAQATNLTMRSELMTGIERWFIASGLTQAKAAKLTGVTQPRFNLVLKGKINELSLDALVNIASAAGIRLKISSVQPKPLAKKAA